MKKLIFVTAILIILLALLVWLGNKKYNEALGAEACPPCPDCGRITAERIRQEAVDYSGERFDTAIRFILPDKNIEIQIGDKVWTKSELDAIK